MDKVPPLEKAYLFVSAFVYYHADDMEHEVRGPIERSPADGWDSCYYFSPLPLLTADIANQSQHSFSASLTVACESFF